MNALARIAASAAVIGVLAAPVCPLAAQAHGMTAGHAADAQILTDNMAPPCCAIHADRNRIDGERIAPPDQQHDPAPHFLPTTSPRVRISAPPQSYRTSHPWSLHTQHQRFESRSSVKKE